MDWEDHATYLYSSVISVGTGLMYLFNPTDSVYSAPLVGFAVPFFVLDFFVCKPSKKLHHACVLWLLAGTQWAPHPAIALYLYKTECITLLNNAVPYVPPWAKAPVTLTFMAAFAKVRVWDGYFFLKNMENELADSPFRVPLLALYAVHLYWFALILRKLWGKHTAKGPRYAKLCQQIAAFSYLGAIPATASCPLAVALHAFICVTSYGFHLANADGQPSQFWFVMDSAAVHAVMLMNVYIAARAWLAYSAVLNAYFFLFRVFNDPAESIAFSSIAILIDSAFILGGDAPYVFKLDYALHLYLICLIFYVQFFNELTYVCFHVLMWFNARTIVSLVKY